MMAAALDDAQKAALAEPPSTSPRRSPASLPTASSRSQPVAELETLIAECLTSIESAPHLVIRCHPDLADTVRAATEARIATSGFTGRLVVIGDPEVALGDGRIEWADGGLVRDRAAISAAIDDAHQQPTSMPAASAAPKETPQ